MREGKELINAIGGFIYDMRHDRELPDLPLGPSQPHLPSATGIIEFRTKC